MSFRYINFFLKWIKFFGCDGEKQLTLTVVMKLRRRNVVGCLNVWKSKFNFDQTEKLWKGSIKAFFFGREIKTEEKTIRAVVCIKYMYAEVYLCVYVLSSYEKQKILSWIKAFAVERRLDYSSCYILFAFFVILLFSSQKWVTHHAPYEAATASSSLNIYERN